MLTFHLGLCCQNLSLEPNFLRRNAAAQAALALGMKDIIEAQRLLWPGAPAVVVQQTEEERWLGGITHYSSDDRCMRSVHPAACTHRLGPCGRRDTRQFPIPTPVSSFCNAACACGLHCIGLHSVGLRVPIVPPSYLGEIRQLLPAPTAQTKQCNRCQIMQL